ncbi:MAG: HipA domain-containing protein [Bacilli bacterium]|nr:HipA domain-containing protein [Bacilli bacterium]
MKQRYCLSCGKELNDENKLWHDRCVAKVFGTKELPIIDLDEKSIEELARHRVDLSYTVPGVQKKLSLCLSKNHERKLTLVDYPSGFILKSQVKGEGDDLPEGENLTMCLAECCGIRVVPHGLLCLKDGSRAYITRRIDRVDGKAIAMEDFCQLSGRLTEDKYHSSYEQCKKVIAKFSDSKKADLSRFVYLLLFCYLTGNSDMHLKNFSLIENNGVYSLSAAYDLLPVNVVFPSDKEEFALTLHGKKKNVTKNDFVKFASSEDPRENLEGKEVVRMMKKLISFIPKMFELIDHSSLSEKHKEEFKALILERSKTFA